MKKHYLMTDIYTLDTQDGIWKRFCPSDGCPTGKIYSFLFNSEQLHEISDYHNTLKFLNEQIVCIYEKKLEMPYAIKFILREFPEENSPISGYLYEDFWSKQEFVFTCL